MEHIRLRAGPDRRIWLPFAGHSGAFPGILRRMEKKSLASAYKEIHDDPFPSRMEIAFYDEAGARQALTFEKVEWTVEGERRGLRYGDNPDQAAALYKPLGANLALSGAETIAPEGRLLCSAELLQFGKHPGKTNLTDVDGALGILRYLPDVPACAIMKHNNPSGVAQDSSLADAYRKAYAADRLAAFGGAVVLNRSVDIQTARQIADSYCEVVAAPEYESGAIELLAERKNLRIIRIPEMDRLSRYAPVTNLDFKTLLDGGCVVQTSFVSRIRSEKDLLPAECQHKGQAYAVARKPAEREIADMLFGWAVETGVTSNSVLYVKDGVTVGVGTGDQDRVGVAERARDKAYRKLEDRMSWERSGKPWNELSDEALKDSIRKDVQAVHGGLAGSIMISDAFFPFRDGIEVGLREGVSAVLQPGGSLRDFESIEACNEYGAAMMFTGQRCFRHG
jgi:phosphoribosylaminoimidazolecarboxamide formyltransferase / IMP cyclohydrolase